jgi:hypothetical protein
MNITGLRVPILNLNDILLYHFSPAAKNLHSATWATAAYSDFSNSDVLRREIMKLFQIVYYLLFTLMFYNELEKKISRWFCFVLFTLFALCFLVKYVCL